MASNDTAALIVAMSANLDKFYKDMDAASGRADKTVKAIEDRFEKGLSQIKGIAAGTIIGNFATEPIQALIDKVMSLGDEFTKTATLAKFLQTSIQRVQELQFAVNLKGVGFDQFKTESQQFLRNAEEAKRALDEVGTLSSKQINRVENDFARLFKANGVSITDNTGKLLDFDQLLSRAADLVANAKTELDKVRIVEMLGLTRDWVRALEGGSAALRAGSEEAHKVGAVVDDELIKKAKEFDHAWDEALVKLKGGFKGLFADLKNLFSDWWANFDKPGGDTTLKKMQQELAGLKAEKPFGGYQGLFTNESQALIDRDIAVLEKAIAARKAFLNLAAETPSAADGEHGAVEPAPGGGKGGPTTGDQSTVIPFHLRNKETPFDQEVKALDKRRALVDAETATIGKNTFEKEKAKATQELLTAAEQAGLTVTEAMKAKIDMVSTAYALAAQHAEETRNKFEGVNDSLRFFGTQAGNFLDLLTDKSKSLRDVGVAALQAFIKQMEMAALTGEGAFAKSLGFNSTTGGVGGIFGLLGSLITGARAAGGPTQGGKSYLVGEHGPEIWTPGSSGMVTPNHVLRQGGGSSVVLNYNVDASGADTAAIARLEYALARHAAATTAAFRLADQTSMDRITRKRMLEG